MYKLNKIQSKLHELENKYIKAKSKASSISDSSDDDIDDAAASKVGISFSRSNFKSSTGKISEYLGNSSEVENHEAGVRNEGSPEGSVSLSVTRPVLTNGFKSKTNGFKLKTNGFNLKTNGFKLNTNGFKSDRTSDSEGDSNLSKLQNSKANLEKKSDKFDILKNIKLVSFDVSSANDELEETANRAALKDNTAIDSATESVVSSVSSISENLASTIQDVTEDLLIASSDDSLLTIQSEDKVSSSFAKSEDGISSAKSESKLSSEKSENEVSSAKSESKISSEKSDDDASSAKSVNKISSEKSEDEMTPGTSPRNSSETQTEETIQYDYSSEFENSNIVSESRDEVNCQKSSDSNPNYTESPIPTIDEQRANIILPSNSKSSGGTKSPDQMSRKLFMNSPLNTSRSNTSDPTRISAGISNALTTDESSIPRRQKSRIPSDSAATNKTRVSRNTRTKVSITEENLPVIRKENITYGGSKHGKESHKSHLSDGKTHQFLLDNELEVNKVQIDAIENRKRANVPVTKTILGHPKLPKETKPKREARPLKHKSISDSGSKEKKKVSSSGGDPKFSKITDRKSAVKMVNKCVETDHRERPNRKSGRLSDGSTNNGKINEEELEKIDHSSPEIAQIRGERDSNIRTVQTDSGTSNHLNNRSETCQKISADSSTSPRISVRGNLIRDTDQNRVCKCCTNQNQRQNTFVGIKPDRVTLEKTMNHLLLGQLKFMQCILEKQNQQHNLNRQIIQQAASC